MGPLRDEVLIVYLMQAFPDLLPLLPVLVLSRIVRCYAQQASHASSYTLPASVRQDAAEVLLTAV